VVRLQTAAHYSTVTAIRGRTSKFITDLSNVGRNSSRRRF